MILWRELRVRARCCALGRVQRFGSMRGGRSRLRYRLHVPAEAAQADAWADCGALEQRVLIDAIKRKASRSWRCRKGTFSSYGVSRRASNSARPFALNGRGGRPGPRRSGSSYSSEPGTSSYVEKNSTSSSAPAPPHFAQRRCMPGTYLTTIESGSADLYAKNESASCHAVCPVLLLGEPSSRPTRRAHIMHRTTPRTKSRRSRRGGLGGSASSQADASAASNLNESTDPNPPVDLYVL
jgi:hypothetical protein